MCAASDKFVKRNMIPVKSVLLFYAANLILIPVLWFLSDIRVNIMLYTGLADIVLYAALMIIFLHRVFRKSDSESFVGSALDFVLIQISLFLAFYMFLMAEHLIQTAS